MVNGEWSSRAAGNRLPPFALFLKSLDTKDTKDTKGTGHLERWVQRNDGEATALNEIFGAARFPFDADASLSVAEWAYENAERARALVWIRCRAQTARLTAEWRECFK